ncbi:hypothetical protein NBT05_05450 [Aquimarina sp. ERC-38]|uniref:hypothetical protein n=1 Tax=Aquimarina sp. ERC-38 TaxID=2949996 RepID=UPI0022472C6C|nr:hypothetical protein [Aquimarina sp. ERC-38]UZO81910.1 hypothetical protein NBT05_05450 [Aquimarina sp. ERC-38]
MKVKSCYILAILCLLLTKLSIAQQSFSLLKQTLTGQKEIYLSKFEGFTTKSDSVQKVKTFRNSVSLKNEVLDLESKKKVLAEIDKTYIEPLPFDEPINLSVKEGKKKIKLKSKDFLLVLFKTEDILKLNSNILNFQEELIINSKDNFLSNSWKGVRWKKVDKKKI